MEKYVKMLTCPNCNGSGAAGRYLVCSQCNGSGEVSNMPNVKDNAGKDSKEE